MGEKKGVLFTDHLKKARPPIFYCAPILSRKDNVLLIRKDIADSWSRKLKLQVNQEMAGDYLTIYNAYRPSGQPNDWHSSCWRTAEGSPQSLSVNSVISYWTGDGCQETGDRQRLLRISRQGNKWGFREEYHQCGPAPEWGVWKQEAEVTPGLWTRSLIDGGDIQKKKKNTEPWAILSQKGWKMQLGYLGPEQMLGCAHVNTADKMTLQRNGPIPGADSHVGACAQVRFPIMVWK